MLCGLHIWQKLALITVIKCFIKGGVLLALDGKKFQLFLFFRPKKPFYFFCEKSEPSWSCLIVNNKQFSLIAYLTLRFLWKKAKTKKAYHQRRTGTKKIPYVRKIFIYVNAFSTQVHTYPCCKERVKVSTIFLRIPFLSDASSWSSFSKHIPRQ